MKSIFHFLPYLAWFINNLYSITATGFVCLALCPEIVFMAAHLFCWGGVGQRVRSHRATQSHCHIHILEMSACHIVRGLGWIPIPGPERHETLAILREQSWAIKMSQSSSSQWMSFGFPWGPEIGMRLHQAPWLTKATAVGSSRPSYFSPLLKKKPPLLKYNEAHHLVHSVWTWVEFQILNIAANGSRLLVH